MEDSVGRSRESSKWSPVTDSLTGASGAEVLRHALMRYSTNFLLNDGDSEIVVAVAEPGDAPHFSERAPTRRESPEERLHQSRVSVRRIRSAMRTFEDLFDEGSTFKLQGDLAWYGGVLGGLRDLEVMRANLVQNLEQVGDPELTAAVTGRVDAMISHSAENRRAAQESSRYRQMVAEMANLEESIRFSTRSLGTAKRVLRRGLRVAWEAADEHFESAQGDPSVERLHRLRIALKRLQYAAEIAALVEDRAMRRLAESAEALQTKLGSVHDEAVAQTWIGLLDFVEDREKHGLVDLARLHAVAQRRALKGWKGDMGGLRRRWREVARKKKG